MNKTLLIGLMILLIAAVGGGIWYGVQRVKKTTENVVSTTPPSSTQMSNGQKMIWGMNLLAFPFPYASGDVAATERPIVWDKQIEYLKQAHISMVRLGVSNDVLPELDVLIPKLHQNGIKIMLILEDSSGPAKSGSEETHGYTFGKEMITRYKDYVDTYQLANEIGGSAIIDQYHSGTIASDYDPKKLTTTLDFVKGLDRAVADVEPTATRVINITAYQTEILQEALDRGIQFDVIGYNWGSGFGTNIENPVIDAKTGATYPLLSTLKSYGKPLWLTEVIPFANKPTDTHQTEATFMQTALDEATKDGFAGFFPYTLVEDVVGAKGFGLLENAKSSTDGLYHITGTRPAFDVYAKAVAQYTK